MLKVMIDAGHSGRETGAVGNGLIEKNINLQVGLKLRDKLSLYDCDVLMTRTDDTEISLNGRVFQQKLKEADVFISIHHNAFNGKTSGFEIYHSIIGGEGMNLSRAVGKEFSKVQKFRYIGPRESKVYAGKDEFFVIRHTTCPAILTEFCYIDSPDYQNFDADLEAELLKNAIVKFYSLAKVKEDTIPEFGEIEIEVPTLEEHMRLEERVRKIEEKIGKMARTIKRSL